MHSVVVDTGIPYARTARTVLSGSDQSLEKTFELIRSGQGQPGDFKVDENANTLYATRIDLDPQDGLGYWQFLQLSSNLYVIMTNCRYHQTRAESVMGEGFLELHFKVSGELLLELTEKETLSVRGPSLLIWNQPRGCNIREWIKGGARESSLTLYCKPELFTHELGLDARNLPPVIASFLADVGTSIEYDVIPLNPALGFSISNLMRPTLTDRFQITHVRAKAYDLLCDLLQFLCTPGDQEETAGKPLSEYETRRLNEARDILSTTFCPAPTIRDLARTIGLNETKLKKGFKRLFGATVYEYGNYHRMQKALELLQSTELPLAEIAEQVGYRFQTSFTAAVKHFFGVTPKQLRESAGGNSGPP